MVDIQVPYRRPSGSGLGKARNTHCGPRSTTLSRTSAGSSRQPKGDGHPRAHAVHALRERLPTPGTILGVAVLMLLIYVVIAALPFTVFADDKGTGKSSSADQEALLLEARDYIQQMGDRSFQALKANPVGSRTRSAQIAVLMIEAMDFPTLSRFSLGRAGRRIKGQTFEKYTRLFATHFIDVATERLEETESSGFSVISAKLLPNDDVLVATAISDEAGDDFEAGWRVRRDGDGYTVVDVFVQGASVGQHFRNRFSDWIGKAGVSGMIKKLESLTKDSPHEALVRSISATSAAAPDRARTRETGRRAREHR